MVQGLVKITAKLAIWDTFPPVKPLRQTVIKYVFFLLYKPKSSVYDARRLRR
jgi:hypothetical protein